MSAQQEMPEGSAGRPRASPSVDLNIYVLLEAIRASMENSFCNIAEKCVGMANTIWGGFMARPSIEGSPNTNLSKKRERTSSQVARDDSSGSLHKKCRNMAREACTAQMVVASPSQSNREGADDDVSLLDHTDSFSDPEQQAVPTLSTLDRATADFEVEETTRPPLSEAMSLRVGHILKTPLLPEKLKFRMDGELCASNALSISAKKVNLSLFNKGGGPMAAIRGHDLQLQSVQKIMTKAMLPLVRLADSFFLA